ncbi:MAG: CRTAC1 family protein [Pirellulales bacterium]
MTDRRASHLWPRLLARPIARAAGLAIVLAVVFASLPARAVVFTDVTTAAGINHVHTYPELIEFLPGEAFFAGGAAAGDFDNDGHVDLIFPRLNDTDIFYRNRGDGTFEQRIASAGFIFPTYTNGVVSGDVDNDGDLDLFMTSVGYTRNYLYLNNGHGFFTDAGINHPVALNNGVVRSGQGASFGDYDNDGYLDLATGDWGNFVANSQSRLFHNLGAAQPGGFEDVTAASGINTYRKDRTYRYAPRFVDLDRDGHTDLTFAADFQTSQLFWNDGDGTFTDGTLPAGVGTDFNGMGTTFGDYDSDGDLDWFITNITNDPDHPGPFGGFNRLYRNDGNRHFTDVTQAAGVRDSRWSWGTTFFDYDNDGDVDLSATNGYNGAGWIDDQTFLWRNDNGVFTDVSTATGITDTQQGRGLIHLDYDEDGDLDLVVVNNAGAPILYRNDGGNDNHYLRIKPQGTVSNRDGIGAWITVTPELTNPDHKLVWEIDGGSSFVSQSERTAHFGLGASTDPVDLVTIEWTSGIVQRLYNVPIDQTLLVVEAAPALLGDYNDDGTVDAADYTVWRNNFGAAAGSLPNDPTTGPIGIAQYETWRQNFGASLAAIADASVPEPASILLLLSICPLFFQRFSG